MTSIAPPAQLMGLIDGYTDYAERTRCFTTRRELPHARGVLIINLENPLEIVSADGREIRLQAGEAFVAGPHLRAATMGRHIEECEPCDPGRSYNARDPEGNDWDFGTYDPWA